MSLQCGLSCIGDLLKNYRMMFVSPSGLENAKNLISSYKKNHVPTMTPDLWRAKKVADSTLHPGLFPGLELLDEG